MYSRESLESLRSVVDPKDALLLIGGISPSAIWDRGDEVRSPCPIHGGDNKTAFSWKRSTGRWSCYTNSCGEGTCKDLYAFTSLVLNNISFQKSAEYVAKLFNFSLKEGKNSGEGFLLSNVIIKDHYRAKKFIVDNLKTLNYLPHYSSDNFQYIIDYLDYRGFSYEDIKIFDFYPALHHNILRLGIPVFDADGKLVGANCRLMDPMLSYPDDTKDESGNVYSVPKYKMTKFSKSSVLYNLQEAKKTAIKDGVIVVEGQLDVVRLYTYGYPNAVATMGTQLTDQQASLLYKHCFHIIFLVEEGEAAHKGVISSIKKLQHGMKISIARLPKGDADSNTKEVIDLALSKAKVLSKKDISDLCRAH